MNAGIDARDALGWLTAALVHGTLLAALTWLLVRFVLRRASASLHALLWSLVLIKFLLPVGPGAEWSLASVVSLVNETVWQTDAPAAKAVYKPAADWSAGDSVWQSDAPSKSAAPQPAIAPADPTAWPTIETVILAAYLAVVGGLLCRRAWLSWLQAHRVARLPDADEQTQAVLAGLAARLSLPLRVRAKVCDDPPAPYVTGLLRPTLVLPADLLERRDELEAVILHELAHVRRGDLLVQSLQTLVGTMLFFWPIVAWVNRRIDLAREMACDEWALRHCAISAPDYARVLLRVAGAARKRTQHAGCAAMASHPKVVERRIDMILQSNTASRPKRLAKAFTVLGLGGWGAFTLSGAALSDDQQPAPPGNVITQRVQVQTATLPMVAGQPAFPQKIRLHERWVSPETRAALLAAQPAADLNADGAVDNDEYSAWLAAKALRDPAAVLAQYPGADLNSDGAVSAEEAVKLVLGLGPEGPVRFQVALIGDQPANGTVAVAAVPAGDILIERDPANSVSETTETMEIKIIQSEDESQPIPGTRKIERVMVTGVGPDGSAITNQDVIVHVDKLGVANMAGGVPGADATPVVAWLHRKLQTVPTAGEAARLLPVVQQLPLSQFLAENPSADENGDGVLTADEQARFVQARMGELHKRLFERFPDADLNGDGLVTPMEMAERKLGKLPESDGRKVIIATQESILESEPR